MLSRREPYHDLGADYHDRRKQDHQITYFTKQLTKLGFAVTLDPLPLPA
jgi:hypothetical protein